MPFLVDTNVLSELKRPRPEQRVIAFLAAAPIEDFYRSTVSLMEIRFGIECSSDPNRRSELKQWLGEKVRPMFTGRVLGFTEDVLLQWRLMIEEGRKAGRTYSQPDLMIAATAAEHKLTLMTRNGKDFAALGVPILNPWEMQP